MTLELSFNLRVTDELIGFFERLLALYWMSPESYNLPREFLIYWLSGTNFLLTVYWLILSLPVELV